MKIEKGMTLEQFVDWINLQPKKTQDCFLFTMNYNNRLKESLIKDMFVNPYERPTWESVKAMPLTSEGVDGKYWRVKIKRSEAEKNLIFNCYKDTDYRHDAYIIDEHNPDDITYLIEFIGDYIFINVNDERTEVTTLGDLFRATNGELELKNFEI